MRSQQLLSRLIEKMRALPQPIICCVQVRPRARLPVHRLPWGRAVLL